MANKELMKGSTPMLVLAVLADGASYGYEIARRIEERSAGVLEGKEGTLYPLLHQLEMSGLLRSYKEIVDGRTRKYYQLTPKGKKSLAKMLAEWKRFSDAVSITVGGPAKLITDLCKGGV